MKSRRSICVIIIGFLIASPFLSQNVSGTLNLGTQGSIPGYRNSYIIWNITECSNFRIRFLYMGTTYSDQYVNPGDMIKLTVLADASFSDSYMYMFGGGGPSDVNPCFVGELEYYNITTGNWTYLNRNPEYIYYGSSYYYAFLMYNSTSGIYYASDVYVEYYLLFIAPLGLSIPDFGDGIIDYYEHSWSDPFDYVNTTSTSLNLTFESGGYNYAKVFEHDNAKMVEEWQYSRSGASVKAEYLNHSYTATPIPVSLPFGSEFLIGTGLCVIGLIIFVRKKALIKK